MQFRKLTFENREGKKLAARLDLPLDEKPVAYALFAHCFACSKNLNAVVNISRSLTRNGIAVLRFDFTGLGESEGDFADTTFSSNVMDLLAASEFLENNYEPPKILIGHSLGGAAVLQAASHIPSSVAVATIAAPAKPACITRFLESSTKDMEARGEGEINLAGTKFKLKKQFLDDLEKVHMEDAVRNLDKALLIFHSPKDTIVNIQNAAEIFMAAQHSKSFISLDQADHLLSNRNDSLYVGSVLAAWARKYIEAPYGDGRQRELQDNRLVARTGKTGYQTEIRVNEHSLIADEPIALGGTNTGPTPYDLLVAALGACTSMTLRMYADRKGWPLAAVTVRLKHQKVNASDCRQCKTSQGMVDHISREVEVVGPLSADQRQKLLEIADKCPVHRTLHSEIVIESVLKEDE